MLAPLYVDAAPLLSPPLTGIGRLTARLVEALSRQRPVRLFTRLGRGDPFAGSEIAIDAPLPDADGDVAAWTAALLRRPRRPCDPAAARHACAYTFTRPPARHFAREVSLLYDFTPLLLPWSHEEATRRLFGGVIASTLRLSDKVVAISHATKHDAGWLSDVRPDDVVVAYPGPSLCAGRHVGGEGPATVPPYLLVVATREPRKNVAFVHDWFLRSALIEPDTELWWVGPRGWLWQVPDTAPGRGRDRRRRLRFLGGVSDAQLCALYRRAACVLYPSLYEGFGFPVLDALRHGTPVLASFHSALQEFAHPALFHFDACDPATLDDAYAALGAARPLAVDGAELDTAHSWTRFAATVSGLATVAHG